MRYKVSKVIALFILFSSGFIANIAAQSSEDYGKFIGGLVGGANFSQVDGDSYKGYDKIGINGGGILYMPMTDVGLPFEGTMAWSMEVLYSQKGAKGKGSTGGQIVGQDIDLHYAEVPFMINYYRGPRKSIYGLGFSFSYLGASEEKIKLDNGNVYSYPFRNVDLNFVLSLNFHLGGGFFLNPRFNYSLISIRKPNEGLGNLGQTDQFNNIYGLRLMYLFNVMGN